MSNIVTLKSFPFDSMEKLNEESGQMEDDRLYEAEIFRKYFAKFLSNGVYYGHYKNYGESSMKVSLDNGLTIKVAKGAGIIEGADYELENNTFFVLERPVSGSRIDRVVVRFDKRLAERNTYLIIKEGNAKTATTASSCSGNAVTANSAKSCTRKCCDSYKSNHCRSMYR